MQESGIIVEIIMERTSSERITQLCGDLDNAFYTQNALANTLYTFAWPSSAEVKIAVGDVACLLEYDALAPEVWLIGSCDSADWENFNISDQTLYYSKNGLSFEIQFIKTGINNLTINILANSNATIEACF